MPREDLIAAKREHVQGMVAAMERNEKVFARVGGRVTLTKGEEVKFQESRLAELEWAAVSGRTDTQIRDRITGYEAQMQGGPYTYGDVDMRGLPQEEIELICLVECLLLALGTHPGVA